MTTGHPAGLAPLRRRAREQLPLWFSFLGGAAAWGVRLGASYFLVPEVCRSGQVGPLHAVAGVTLVVAVAAAYVGYRMARDARDRRAEGDADAPERTEFLGLAAAFLSAVFAGAIVLESAANFVVDPCLAAGVR